MTIYINGKEVVPTREIGKNLQKIHNKTINAVPPSGNSYDRALEALGLERTRENYLFVLYNGELPDEWDEEAEAQLPPDLRIT